MGLLAELKRRNVIRMAGLYLVAAWLLVQVAATLLPAFEAPAWVFRTLVIVLALGFLPVLIFSWVYELTPEGLRRDEDVPAERSIGHVTARRIDRAIIAVLLVALGYFAIDKFALAPRRSAVSEQPAVSDAPPPLAASGNERSIAVLPFQNMSDDKGNQFFADGIAEELLNQLAHAPELQVAGRTSSFAFRDKNEDMRVIAQQLGVSWLLEGSVRRAGNRVKITAQLIKAASGFHAWSETYDRDLTDIFAVQDEIARAIAAALKSSLAAHAAKPQIPVAAYDAYLKGLALLATRQIEDMASAREQFRQSLALSPEYAPAMVGIARVNLLLPQWEQTSGTYRDSSADIAEAERLITRAIALDPGNAAAYAALGSLRSEHQWRWPEAAEAFARAQELAPGSAEVANFSGDFYRLTLDRERALMNEMRALELDPLARYNLDDVMFLSWEFHDYADAVRRAETVRAKFPAQFDPYYALVHSLGQLKRFDEMHRAIAEARERTKAGEAEYLQLDVWAALAEGRRDDALALQAKLERYAEGNAHSPAELGYTWLLLGDSQKARRWLERACEARDYLLLYREPVHLEVIASDPVTRPIAERPGLKELRELRRRNGG